MNTKRFKELCDSVVLVEEFPPLSRLRQKVAGCYDLFGMCPEGEVVGLDTMGNVNCLKAEINDNNPWCQENDSLCPLYAKASNILGVIKLLRDFMISNFISKDGTLPDNKNTNTSIQKGYFEIKRAGKLTVMDYNDEDMGVSRYLSDDEKAKKRFS